MNLKLEPKINIIILNWNGYEDTSELLRSLKNISYNNYSITIIDNNSTNNDVEKLKSKCNNDFEILKSHENLGYAGGNNLGIKYLLENDGDFVLLLNNDTTVDEYFLEKLVRKFGTDNTIGISAPQIYFFNQPSKIWSTGGKISKIRGSGVSYSSKNFNKINKRNGSFEFVSGCCMLVKKEVFQKVGFFDENYFLYDEDTDFCFRVKKNGYKICVEPDSKIYHKVKGSTSKLVSTLPLYYETRNRLYFAKKNLEKFSFLTTCYIYATMSLKSFIWIIWGKYKNVHAVLLAIKEFKHNNMGKTVRNFIIK